MTAFVDFMAMLEATDSANMLFCFRWLIVSFKREFSFEDIKRVWEVRCV